MTWILWRLRGGKLEAHGTYRWLAGAKQIWSGSARDTGAEGDGSIELRRMSDMLWAEIARRIEGDGQT